ncbi:ORF6N domain-containing protein [Candidatus Saccharibacteria bacterium]|nr:ORF6N domain-containing protein [Candidatus Saccharibacteria bacterium]
MDEKIDITGLIHPIRGRQVVLDCDIANLYKMRVSDVNRAAARNLARFPEDFRFQLTKDEYEDIKRQIGEAKAFPKKRALPFVYTESGISMLSGVIHSDIAIKTSIQIMRSFVEMRRFVASNAAMFERISEMELKQLKYQKETDEKLEKLFETIDERDCEGPTQKIFFEGQIYDAYSFLVEMIQTAKREIILVDGYANINTLDILKNKRPGVKINLLTYPSSKLSLNEIKKFNQEYPGLQVYKTTAFHDRFLIFDEKKLYHIGASLKDAGKKTFAVSKLEEANETAILLDRIKTIIKK